MNAADDRAVIVGVVQRIAVIALASSLLHCSSGALAPNGTDLATPLGNCSPDDLGCFIPPDFATMHDLGRADLAGTCPSTCAAGCSPGEDCLASATVAAVCAATCTTTGDCANGFICIAFDDACGIDLRADDQRPRHCVSSAAAACPGTNPLGVFDGQHCDSTNANVIALPTTPQGPYNCAFQYIACPHGCSRAEVGVPFVMCNP
jgi:hypothetical protein